MTSTTVRAKVVLAELESLGLTVADLVSAAGSTPYAASTTPTLAEYLPSVRASYAPRTCRTYNSYWRLAEEMFGDLQLSEVTTDHVAAVAEEAARRAGERRAGSDGRASRESTIAALRAVFTKAHRAGLVRANPALLVDKPRRLESRRRALSQRELDDVWAAVSTTTKDPDLDLLLLRFHLETGARRMGAINLRLRDLDPDRQTVWLREKFGAEREQPVSASLLEAVASLAAERGSVLPEHGALVHNRLRAGAPASVSDRTYDRIFTRAQAIVPWAQRTPLTAHVLRYTAITAIERVAGFAVACRFAGHIPGSVTGTYTKADIGEVARAVQLLTGEPHPLAS